MNPDVKCCWFSWKILSLKIQEKFQLSGLMVIPRNLSRGAVVSARIIFSLFAKPLDSS